MIYVDLDAQSAEANRGRRGTAAGPAQESPGAGTELLGIERLADLVVGSEIQAHANIGSSGSLAEDDRGNRVPLAHLAKELESVRIRQE